MMMMTYSHRIQWHPIFTYVELTSDTEAVRNQLTRANEEEDPEVILWQCNTFLHPIIFCFAFFIQTELTHPWHLQGKYGSQAGSRNASLDCMEELVSNGTFPHWHKILGKQRPIAELKLWCDLEIWPSYCFCSVLFFSIMQKIGSDITDYLHIFFLLQMRVPI